MRINEIVRRMDPPRYTVGDAARLVGRTEDTLKRWKRNGTFVPSETVKFGKIEVDAYTQDDISALRDFIRGRQRVRGPIRSWERTA